MLVVDHQPFVTGHDETIQDLSVTIIVGHIPQDEHVLHLCRLKPELIPFHLYNKNKSRAPNSDSINAN